MYKARKHIFDSTKSAVRHMTLYNEIAACMTQFGIHLNAKQCKDEMNSLLQEFRLEYDRQQQTGQAPSTWAWYGTFLQMNEGSANLDAPFAVSLGSASLHTVKGAPAISLDRSTRTRPTCVQNQPKAPKNTAGKKKLVFKSWVQDNQEAQLQQRIDMVQEIRLMREGYEKRSEQRLKILEALILKRTSDDGKKGSSESLDQSN